jgi:hypothetical protein
MSNPATFELLLAWLIRTAGDDDRAEVSEEQVICFLQKEFTFDRDTAIAEWQGVSEGLRQKKIVRNGHLVHWQLFRNCLQIIKLATAEELQSTAEIYESTTAEEVARRIRTLTGFEFERFLTAVLGRHPEFSKILVTQASRDGGIDFRGEYVPPGAQLQGRLIGQAKQVAVPVTASVARDFVGALDTSGERRVIGLIVSTAGFTEPADDVFESSHYHIIRWGMDELLKYSRGIVTKQIAVSFEVPDQIFWDEVIGST